MSVLIKKAPTWEALLDIPSEESIRDDALRLVIAVGKDDVDTVQEIEECFASPYESLPWLDIVYPFFQTGPEEAASFDPDWYEHAESIAKVFKHCFLNIKVLLQRFTVSLKRGCRC